MWRGKKHTHTPDSQMYGLKFAKYLVKGYTDFKRLESIM